MKSIHLYFLVLFSFSMTSFAQFGNGMGNGIGGRNNGRMSQQQNDMPPAKVEEKSPEASVDEAMPELTSEINLDALQQVAVKQILVESIKRKGVVMKKEDNQEAKYKELLDINENADKNIEALLNKDQKEKYKNYKVKKSDPKQYKKSRKREKKDKN